MRFYWCDDCDFFILFLINILFMAILNIEMLQEIVDKLPNDFEVGFEDRNGSVSQLSDEIIVKVTEKRLVLRLY